MTLTIRTIFLSLVTTALAQYGPGGRYGPNSPDNNENNDNNTPVNPNSNSGNSNPGYNPYSNPGGSRGGPSQSFLDNRQTIILAHGILASLAFVILFPIGSILIRLGKFRGVWLVHGLFQLFAYLIYIAAFGIGIWMVTNIPANLLTSYHPIIGIVILALLFFQPILGFVHHLMFKKYSRRTVWSHAHLWLGRVVITAGMINGGLGLMLASGAPAFSGFAPTRTHIIAYGAVAGAMWLLWVVAAIVGERRRAKGLRQRRAREAEKENETETEMEMDHRSESSEGERSRYEGEYVSELASYERGRGREKERFA